jgi:hypothetical protein
MTEQHADAGQVAEHIVGAAAVEIADIPLIVGANAGAGPMTLKSSSGESCNACCGYCDQIWDEIRVHRLDLD